MKIKPELMDAADLLVNSSKPTETELAEISAAIRARKQTGKTTTNSPQRSKSPIRR